jgi:formylglycine-generating enzyme required for sulfatase activity
MGAADQAYESIRRSTTDVEAIARHMGYKPDNIWKHIPVKPQRVRDGPIVMMELPGGTLRMGSPNSDDMAFYWEKPQHTVTVSGFRIGVTPVTAGLYCEVMQQEPPPDDRQQFPVVDITWYDAIQFCNALSEREGYQPCYRQVRSRWVCDWSADGYRLPTESEWEYACRAGTETRYSFGDDPELLDKYA